MFNGPQGALNTLLCEINAMNVKEEGEEIANSLLSKLGENPDEFQFLIPDWEPQETQMAIRWLKSQVWEGYYVTYKIDQLSKRVYLKSWEDDEPDFNSLNYTT